MKGDFWTLGNKRDTQKANRCLYLVLSESGMSVIVALFYLKRFAIRIIRKETLEEVVGQRSKNNREGIYLELIEMRNILSCDYLLRCQKAGIINQGANSGDAYHAFRFNYMSSLQRNLMKCATRIRREEL